jgi:hypothetical protein
MRSDAFLQSGSGICHYPDDLVTATRWINVRSLPWRQRWIASCSVPSKPDGSGPEVLRVRMPGAGTCAAVSVGRHHPDTFAAASVSKLESANDGHR